MKPTEMWMPANQKGQKLQQKMMDNKDGITMKAFDNPAFTSK